MAAPTLRDDASRVRDDAERLGRAARRAASADRDSVHDSGRDSAHDSGRGSRRDPGPDLARQAADRARGLVGDRVDRWRGQAEEAADVAGENLENARVYVVERVQERPLTATLAALGVGFLLGALLSGSRR